MTKQNLLAFLGARYDSVQNMETHEKFVYLTTQTDLHNLRIEVVRRNEKLQKKSKKELKMLFDKTYKLYSYYKRTAANLSDSDDNDNRNMSGLLKEMEEQEDLLEAVKAELSARGLQTH